MPPATDVLPTVPVPPSVPPAFTVEGGIERGDRAIHRQRAGADVNGADVGAGARQRPGRTADLVEGAEALILRARVDLRHIERGACRCRRAGRYRLPVPSTLPVIAEPGASVSVLPTPPNWIAARRPLMAPALKTDEPPVAKGNG